MRNIAQKDIPIDIGEDVIKRTAGCYLLGTAVENMNVGRIVDGYDTVRALLCGQDGQHGGTAAHVEYLPTVQVERQYGSDHLLCRSVITRTKGHTRIDDDRVRKTLFRLMKRGTDEAFLTDAYRLEIVLLPLLVPVTIGNGRVRVADYDIRQGKVGEVSGAKLSKPIAPSSAAKTSLIVSASIVAGWS